MKDIEYLKALFAKSKVLEKEIVRNLKNIGYEG